MRPVRLLKGAATPRDNDSRDLLDVDRRGVPGRERMRTFRDEDEVDLAIVGCGAGGSVLAQRLARQGRRIVVLVTGPFWDPDTDGVSDEEGAHDLYWNANRIVGGGDPIELGKNNSGHGVGGSMVHFAGYAPRFHPSDFETRTRDGVGADWPIAYRDLHTHYEQLELELPVAGQHWPWGVAHGYPHGPHPVGGAAERAWQGARACGIEMRVGPVAITNGTFGNRPHCIYRGFCLQGCKVGAKASPLVTHVPDALKHGVEVRARAMVTRIETDASGACTGVAYRHGGRERAGTVAVAAYSIESPRLLLSSGIGNHFDQVGRVVDADHRVWGVPNLFVCDGSVMPTQGAANPALTIMALASRLAQRLAAGRIVPARAAVA